MLVYGAVHLYHQGMESMTKDWRDKGACIQADPELFFPTSSEKGKAYKDQVAAAKAFCVTCLVKLECFQYAMDNDERSGIWGETTWEERRKAKRRAARTRHNG